MVDEENKKGEAPEVSEYDRTVLQSEDEIRSEGKEPGGGPSLIVAQGPRQGSKFPLIAGDNTIGRLMGSEVLLEDHSVSRRHVIVTQTPQGFTVEDCGSKNGTFVNGNQITEKVSIGHGDIIQLGIYSLRLLTRDVPSAEEVKPLPAEWEGKTVMLGAKSSEEETATMIGKEEDLKGAKEGNEEPKEEKTGEIAVGQTPEEKKAIEEVEKIDEELEELEKEIEEAKVAESKKRPVWWTTLLIGLLVAAILGGGAYVYVKFYAKPKKPKEAVKVEKVEKGEKKTPGDTEGEKTTGEKKPVEGAEGKTVAETGPAEKIESKKEELSATIPVFLDFASSPLPAKVSFKGQDYGMTPVKIQMKLDVDREYTAEAVFDLKEISEQYKEEAKFKIDRDEPLVPILFKGPIGVMKVMELPRDVELYIEGYFVYDPFNAKTAKLDNVVFGKPVYIPYGKYVIELRTGKELAGAGEYIKAIRYRREILVSEDNPIFVLKIVAQDLTEFPVEVVSVPEGSDVFIDTKRVGRTPFKGIFPLGEHLLTLRKDGYFEHKQDLKMDSNTPVKLEIVLKTTVAGENINAGKHLMQKGRYKDAISKLAEVFKQSPTTGEKAQAQYLIGSCFVHMGDLTTAEDYFKQAIEEEEMKYPSMLGLVSVYHGLGRRDEAVPHLVEVLLNAKEEVVKKEAMTLFQQVSPLRSIMYIHSDPEGARVMLNDKLMEQLTPLILPDLSLGNYKVHIEKDGYLPQDLSISLSVNEFNPVLVKLKPNS